MRRREENSRKEQKGKLTEITNVGGK